MSTDPPRQIHWLEPWHPIGPGDDRLSDELRREAGPNHPLGGIETVAVARRADCDEVLFLLLAHEPPLAVVHLTWSGRPEPDPRWPGTVFYASWEDWVDRCMIPDHQAAALMRRAAFVRNPSRYAGFGRLGRVCRLGLATRGNTRRLPVNKTYSATSRVMPPIIIVRGAAWPSTNE